MRADHEKDLPVEKNHDDAGDVEGAHRGVDEEVCVVEGAEVGGEGALGRVVHAEGDGGGDGQGDEPGGAEGEEDSLGVFVLGVLDGSRDGDESARKAVVISRRLSKLKFKKGESS